jgi:hypothetical protein
MRTPKLIRRVLPNWNRFAYVLTPVAAVLFVAGGLFAQGGDDPELRVLRTGLGSGTVTSDAAHPGIDCGADCSEGYASTATVILTATPQPGSGSSFTGWGGDCTGTGTCEVTMDAARSVRAEFSLPPIPTITDFTPDGTDGTGGIKRYLGDNPSVDTPAEFIAALPREYRQNWILMSRSESLQTGIADSPRILLPSADMRSVFTVGMETYSSYPGSHPNAIEYMQWDAAQKNFRFHEIVLDDIPEMFVTLPDGSTTSAFAPRERRITIDDAKCSKCHSTRNVVNLNRAGATPVPGPFPGTDGVPAGTVRAKNKPNWDTYDSWGGAMPFNRDRIYQGSVEAATFRKIFNLWTWRDNEPVRAIIEQLELQPPDQFLPDGSLDVTRSVPREHVITRTVGGADDGHIRFAFDPPPPAPPVSTEPSPAGSSPTPVTYSFDGVAGTPPGTTVTRDGAFVTLHHSGSPTNDEGRAVQFFDLLGGGDGNLNQQRIGDELASHRFATGNVPLDARPIALAITKGCMTRNAAGDGSVTPAPSAGLGFFTARHGGMTLNQVFDDTRARAQSLPRRKADIQKLNLDRTGDSYLDLTITSPIGLIQRYGGATDASTDTSPARLRQEVFRRRPSPPGAPLDSTVMGGVYVDREDYSVGAFNTEKIALYRFFLEPLGVSVDKWSMGVRGRSRTYSFADVFNDPIYVDTITSELEASLNSDPFPGLTPPYTCASLNTAVNDSFTALPPATGGGAVPTYTDVQRIFNKGCIECHGGLSYPPFNRFFDATYLDLSEDEEPAAGDRRLSRSHRYATSFTTTDPASSRIFELITRDNEDCTPTGVFFGMMPCGGPKLSPVDIETIRRWIEGGRPSTEGDPHLRTVDGTNYDFQSAGEFVLLRGEDLEIQARHTPVETEGPMGTNEHTGLSSCVSINTAVAFRLGPHRITYQPNLDGRPDPGGLQLRVDGELIEKLGERGVVLESGGRILPTTAPGGIQLEFPGGTDIVVTPGWWDNYQVWYLNINVRHARATEGVMGAVAPRNWLPALPDGSFLGPKPSEARQRYLDLYEKFADAWRVSDATSLFDYAPGTSTGTFTLDSWPGEAAQTCRLPKDPDGVPGKPPLKPLPLEAAKQHCRAVVEDARRTNCEMDVVVTGEPGFAETYLRTERIQLNKPPDAPVLLSPEDNKVELGTTVSFDWKKTVDAEGDGLTYMHCVWPAGAGQNFNQCKVLPKQMGMFGGFDLYLLLAILIVCLLVLIVLLVRAKKGRGLLALLAIVVLVAVVLIILFGRAGDTSRTVAELTPGKAYFWKVIAEDGKGGTVESKTRRFRTK